MADLAQIAQSGIDPASGSYLSAERRKAIFAKSRNVSSNIFKRGGALAPINNQPDSGALALVQTQSQTITSLQEQVNGLRTQVVNLNNVVSIQTQTIGGLQEQVGGVGNNIKQLSGSIDGITRAISTDSILEQNRTKQEQEEQRRATEQGLRIGRESLLEKALQAALIAPVQKIATKAQSILSKVAQFFTTLFIGWFTNQGIEVLKGLSEGNGKKLEEIKNNVLKGLGIAAGTLLLLNGGFVAIAGKIAKFSLKMGGWLLKNTVGKFFGFLGSTIAGLLNIGKAPAVATATSAAGGAFGYLRGIFSGASKLFTGASGIMDAVSGQNVDAAVAAGALFAPGALKIPFGLAYGADAIAEMFGSNLFGKNPNEPPTTKTPEKSKEPGKTESPDFSQPPQYGTKDITPTEEATPQSRAQTPVIPAPSGEMVKNFQMAWDNRNNGFARGRIEGAWDKMSPEEQQQAKVWAKSKGYDWTEMRLAEKPVVTQSAQVQSPSQPAQIDTLSKSNSMIGPTPEPTPNVVYKRIGSSAQQQSGAAPTGGSVNEVPTISASNPDNFYVLYSQVNYNVVI
jgi:hypothetical protein